MNNNQIQPTPKAFGVTNHKRFHLKTWQWLSVLIIVAAIAGGVFWLQSFKTSVSQPIKIAQRVAVVDSLLSKEKEICSPYSDDGTPYCFGPEIMNNFSLAFYEKKCPNTDDVPEEVVIYRDIAVEAVPPSGKARIAYYCRRLNQFWVSDYDSEKVPMGYWYGPFVGYPVPGEAQINGISITTDKTEYEQGETVKITARNINEKKSCVSGFGVEKFEKGKWVNVKRVWCLCGALCNLQQCEPLQPNEQIEYKWNQEESWCSGPQGRSEAISKQVTIGVYRIKIQTDGEDIYSNEFRIKEKVSQKDNQPCILKNSSCCRGEVCNTVNVKCKEGTDLKIKGCDENCKVIFECVPINENQTSIGTTKITNFTGPTHITHLDIYGDTIVWTDDSQGSYNVYAYNIITKKKQAIQPMPADQVQPAIYEDKIVWVQASSPDNYELYLYNLNTKQKTALKKPKVTSFGPVFPDIYGNTVVWEEQGVETGTINTASQIYSLNLDTQELKKLSLPSATGYECAAMPKIYDNIVVWADRSIDPTNSHINIYDLDINQGTSITSFRDLGQRVLHQYPNIYQDKIVWSQALRDLFVYDIINETVFPLNHSELQWEAFMNIYQDKVVFKGCKQTINECDIYLLDINSQNITNISQSGKLQLTNVWPPAVYQNKIVWIETDYSLSAPIYNLYMAEIGNK